MPAVSDYQCEAIKPKTIYHEEERCTMAQKVLINKKKLCHRHAMNEAMAMAFAAGKAERIAVPLIVQEIGVPVKTVKDLNKKDK